MLPVWSALDSTAGGACCLSSLVWFGKSSPVAGWLSSTAPANGLLLTPPAPVHQPALCTPAASSRRRTCPGHPLLQADEVFTTGTAVVVCSVGSLTYKGTRKQFTEPGQPGPVALEMYTGLTQLQTEQDPDPFSWVCPVC